jgi:hypothetical protein
MLIIIYELVLAWYQRPAFDRVLVQLSADSVNVFYEKNQF